MKDQIGTARADHVALGRKTRPKKRDEVYKSLVLRVCVGQGTGWVNKKQLNST